MPELSSTNPKIDVALLGATGVVGQAFLHRLAGHPFFRPALLMASPKRSRSTYKECVQWVLPMEMPREIMDLAVESLDIDKLKRSGIRFVFSALPASVAAAIEPSLAEEGFFVFSNASAMRCHDKVPILIPDVNPGHLGWIESQGFPGKGFIVTNANCSTTGLVTALSPFKPLGIEELFVSTYQAVSGAGYPGLSHLKIAGNAVPYISGEEEKIVKETRKILETEASIQPTCVRIDSLWGHLEAVTVQLRETPDVESLIALWGRTPPEIAGLPGMPAQPVVYRREIDQPQPAMSWWGTPPGMTVYTGRLRIRDGRVSFLLLCNNLVKGAAGGSVANAELFLSRYGDRL